VLLLSDALGMTNGISVTYRELFEHWHHRSQPCELYILGSGFSAERVDKENGRFVVLPSHVTLPRRIYPEVPVGIPARAISRLFEQKRINVIHSASPGPLGLYGLMYARAKRVPLITSHHTRWSQFGPYLLPPSLLRPANLVVPFLIRRLYGGSEVTVAHSPAAAAEAAEVGAKRTHYAPMGVKLPTSSASELRRLRGGARRELQEMLGLREDAPIILFVGRVSKEKDVGLVSEAVARIQETLVLVGDGPLRSALKDEPHIRSTGLLSGEGLDRAFLAADIMASACTTDTLGRVFLESLAHGTPILVPDRGQHLSAIPEQPPAVWTYEWSPTDATNLATALRSTLASLECGSNAETAALDLAKTCDWTRVIDSHLEPYHSVALKQVS